MLISQREGPSWGQHIWSLEQQWLQIDWDKHRGVPWGQGAKAEEEGASWQRSSWGQGGAARRTQALGWVPPEVWGRKGGLLSLEEEKCTKPVGSSTEFAVMKDRPLRGMD